MGSFRKCVSRLIIISLLVIIALCVLVILKFIELNTMITVATLIVTIITLIVVIKGVCMAGDQLKHSNDIAFVQLSNDHNWKLYDEYCNLPSSHPIKSDYTKNKEEMMWRVLHLTHLNLLEIAFKAKNKGIVEKEDVEQWVKKYKTLFHFVKTDPPESDGRKTLEDIKQRKEEYSEDFREWLEKNKIW